MGNWVQDIQELSVPSSPALWTLEPTVKFKNVFWKLKKNLLLLLGFLQFAISLTCRNLLGSGPLRLHNSSQGSQIQRLPAWPWMESWEAEPCMWALLSMQLVRWLKEPISSSIQWGKRAWRAWDSCGERARVMARLHSHYTASPLHPAPPPPSGRPPPAVTGCRTWLRPAASGWVLETRMLKC